MSEVVYSGLDRARTRDWSGILVDWMRDFLPAPQISPTCAKKGHLWSDPLVLEWPETVRVYGCVRCAERGLVVLKDDQAKGREQQRHLTHDALRKAARHRRRGRRRRFPGRHHGGDGMSLLHAFASGSILAGAWELSHSWPLCVGIFAFAFWTHLRFNKPADTTEAG